jgi:undecaprenyl pyrophosphate synthase
MDNQEIDLSKVNWNNLSPEEFQNLSEKMNERNNRIKETKERKKRTLSENILVSIRGNAYNIPNKVYDRLKNMSSAQSKEKLIDEILVTYKPVPLV